MGLLDSILGQTGGMPDIANLAQKVGLDPAMAESAVAALAEAAVSASLDDIGAIAYAADIAQMRHETIGIRVFRS